MRARNFVDLAGQRFHLLTALSVASTERKTIWLCRCDCGASTTATYQHLVNGLKKSCGCWRRKVSAESLRARTTTHGLSHHRWFQTWAGMMDRCHNPRNVRYRRYGGRGILVCARWHDPANFGADMGAPPDGATLERIDNDAGYSPDNCRWANYEEQNNNRSSTRLITFNGQTMSGAQWARSIGISKGTMYSRLKVWPLSRALTEPAGPTKAPSRRK